MFCPALYTNVVVGLLWSIVNSLRWDLCLRSLEAPFGGVHPPCPGGGCPWGLHWGALPLLALRQRLRKFSFNRYQLLFFFTDLKERNRDQLRTRNPNSPSLSLPDVLLQEEGSSLFPFWICQLEANIKAALLIPGVDYDPLMERRSMGAQWRKERAFEQKKNWYHEC